MQRVVVTGCNGYIGSSVICSLAASGKYYIIGVDNLVNNNEIIKRSLDEYHNKDFVEFNTKYDDIIIHLAAYTCVPKSVENPWRYYNNNLNKTAEFVKANYMNIQHMIYSSTSSAFTGHSPYALSKLGGEHCIRQYLKKYTIFRFFNVFGKDGDLKCFNEESLMQKLIESKETGEFIIYGDDYDTKDGTCIREYTHIKDVADSLVKAVAVGPANNEYECLSYGGGYTVKEMIDMYEIINGVKLDVKIGSRRTGDTAENVSPSKWEHMVQNYTLEDIVQI